MIFRRKIKLPALNLSVKHKNGEEGRAFSLVPSTTDLFKNKNQKEMQRLA